jgi:hypothetical protein
MLDEFHKPFLKNLVFVAFVTIFAMVSSHYVINLYINNNSKNQTSIYTTQESSISSKP